MYTLHMDHPHIERVLLFMLVVNAIPVHPLELHHSNKKSHEFLRLTRSATSNGSLDQTRASSVVNCYGSTCVSNKEFCSETKQGCEMCRYGHGECTVNWDCFQFCSEKKAEEICGGPEGSIETTGSPLWPYIILVIFIISVAINIYFAIKILLRECEKHKRENRRKSYNEESKIDETLDMLSNSQDNGIQMSNQIPQTTVPKEPSAPPDPNEQQDSEKQVQRQEPEKSRNSYNESEKDDTLDTLFNSQDNGMQMGNQIEQTTLPKEPFAPPDTYKLIKQVQRHEPEKSRKSDNEESEKDQTLDVLDNIDSAAPHTDKQLDSKTQAQRDPDSLEIGETVPLNEEVSPRTS